MNRDLNEPDAERVAASPMPHECAMRPTLADVLHRFDEIPMGVEWQAAERADRLAVGPGAPDDIVKLIRHRQIRPASRARRAIIHSAVTASQAEVMPARVPAPRDLTTMPDRAVPRG